MKYRLEQNGKTYDVDVEITPGGYLLRGPDGVAHPLRLVTRADGSRRAITPWCDIELQTARRGAEVWADANGRRLSARVERTRASTLGSDSGAARGAVSAPMAGKLLRVSKQPGDSVKAGEPVAVIEAMKMENELVAPVDGVVVEVAQSAPATVDKGALILRVEPK